MQNVLSISKKISLAQLTKAHFSVYYSSLASKPNQNVTSDMLSSFQPEKIISEEIKIDEDTNNSFMKDDNQIESTTDENEEENYLNLAISNPVQVQQSSSIQKIIKEAIKQNEKLELLDDLKDEAKKTLYKQMKYCLTKTLNLIGKYKMPLMVGTVTAAATFGIYKAIEYIVAQKQFEKINKLQGENSNFKSEINQLKVENQLIKKQYRNIMTTLKKKNNELLKLTEENEKKSEIETENKEKIQQLQQQFEFILTQINSNNK